MMKKNDYSTLLMILIFIWIITTLTGTWIIFNKSEPIVGYSSALINVDVAFLDSVLFTEYDKYSPGVNVTIKGYNFTYNGPLELYVLNSSYIFAKNITLDETGDFVQLWETTGVGSKNYTIFAYDLDYPDRNKNKTIELLPPFYWIGRIIDPDNLSVPSDVIVHDAFGNMIANTSENYSLTFNYGAKYNISVYPDLAPIESVVINLMANEGPLGDALILDDTDENASDFIEFDELVATSPLVEEYQFTTITILHSFSDNFAVYKCITWNNTGRYCPGEAWIKIKDIPDGVTKTMVTLQPGDPGIGVGPNPCGNGVCEFVKYGETPLTCWADCCTDNDNDNYAIEGGNCGVIDCNDGDSSVYPGAIEICDGIDNDCDGFIDENCVILPVEELPSEIISPRSTICVEEWECTGWGDCLPSGKQYRSCWDLNKCDDAYTERIKRSLKPKEVRSCEYVAVSVEPVIEKPQSVRILFNYVPFIISTIFLIILFIFVVVLQYRRKIVVLDTKALLFSLSTEKDLRELLIQKFGKRVRVIITSHTIDELNKMKKSKKKTSAIKALNMIKKLNISVKGNKEFSKKEIYEKLGKKNNIHFVINDKSLFKDVKMNKTKISHVHSKGKPNIESYKK